MKSASPLSRRTPSQVVEQGVAMSLGASGLLAAWEDGTTQHPVQRGLTLLAAAWPELPEPVFSQMSIGQRDAALLTLREQLFGPGWPAWPTARSAGSSWTSPSRWPTSGRRCPLLTPSLGWRHQPSRS